MTFVPTVRLDCAGLDSLVFGTGGIDLLALDLGDADIRVVMMNAPDANGIIDTTQFRGARVITMQVFIDQPTWERRSRVRQFTSPRLRSTLVTKIAADAPEMQTVVRGGPFSDAMTVDDVEADQLFVTMQFISSTGVFESSTLNVVNVYASAAGAEMGRAYDLTFDRTYPASPIVGTATVLNRGNEVAYPILRIYGPCTNPVVTNMTTGVMMSFTGLTILAGDFVEIDTRAKTIRYNGLAIDSRYSTLAFPTSSWLFLAPGSNTIRYQPATYTSPPSNVEVSWRDSYL